MLQWACRDARRRLGGESAWSRSTFTMHTKWISTVLARCESTPWPRLALQYAVCSAHCSWTGILGVVAHTHSWCIDCYKYGPWQRLLDIDILFLDLPIVNFPILTCLYRYQNEPSYRSQTSSSGRARPSNQVQYPVSSYFSSTRHKISYTRSHSKVIMDSPSVRPLSLYIVNR